jgi:hypothetical protein
MKQEMIMLACQAFVGKLPLLVLRGNDVEARAEGDIDILVPAGQAVIACHLLSAEARSAGWFLLSFRNIGYLASVVLTKPSEDGNDAAVKIDFFSGLEWYGVGSGVVSARFFGQVLPEALASKMLQPLAAAINFFQKCMIVGQLSRRDWTRVSDGGADGEYLLKTAATLKLPLHAADIAARGVRGLDKWRLRFASAGATGLVGKFAWFWQAVWAHLRFKLMLGFDSGHILGLSGLDGSGKSTQMDRLLTAYKRAGMTMPRLVHLLPQWIPLPHQIIRRKKTAQNYTRPYSEAPVNSRWSGMLRLAYYLVAFAVAKVGMQFCAGRDTVYVMDRSFADFAADLTRSRIPNYCLPSWLLNLCMPNGSLIYLDASPATVVERKGELTLEKATALRSQYLDIFGRFEGQVINAEGTQAQVYSRILACIDAVYFERLSHASSR